jgi:hypothetical protein
VNPDGASPACWPELAARLHAAATQAKAAARLAPPSGAEALLESLNTVSACLCEAERLCRSGLLEQKEDFRRELEQWAADAPLLRAWVGASAALAAGWAAAAGVGAGYGPDGGRPGQARGGISESG